MLVLIIIVFPLIHLSIFKLNRNEYSFNQEYLIYKKSLINEKLINYKGHEILEDFLNRTNDSILNSQIYDSQHNVVSVIGDYRFKIVDQKGLRRPSSRDYEKGLARKTIVLISSLNNNKVEFDISDETLKSAILTNLNERKELINLIKNPIRAIKYKDIWIECSTGFLLGNIKPISLLAQFIQSLQVFVFFITVTILGTFISNNSQMIPKRKSNQ